jgi:hypothetical protein
MIMVLLDSLYTKMGKILPRYKVFFIFDMEGARGPELQEEVTEKYSGPPQSGTYP